LEFAQKERTAKIHEFKMLSVELTKSVVERKAIEQSSLEINRQASKAEVEKTTAAAARAVIDKANLGRYKTAKEYTVAQKNAEAASLEIKMAGTRKLLAMSTTQANIELYSNQLADQKSALLAKQSSTAKSMLTTNAKFKRDVVHLYGFEPSKLDSGVAVPVDNDIQQVYTLEHNLSLLILFL